MVTSVSKTFESYSALNWKLCTDYDFRRRATCPVKYEAYPSSANSELNEVYQHCLHSMQLYFWKLFYVFNTTFGKLCFAETILCANVNYDSFVAILTPLKTRVREQYKADWKFIHIDKWLFKTMSRPCAEWNLLKPQNKLFFFLKSPGKAFWWAFSEKNSAKVSDLAVQVAASLKKNILR